MTLKCRVVVCRGPECGAKRDSAAVHVAAASAIAGLPDSGNVVLDWQSCFGRCSQGPNVLVREIIPAEPRSLAGLATLPGTRGRTALYNHMTIEKIGHVVTAHVGSGTILREYIARPAPTQGGIAEPVTTCPQALDPGESKS